MSNTYVYEGIEIHDMQWDDGELVLLCQFGELFMEMRNDQMTDNVLKRARELGQTPEQVVSDTRRELLGMPS